MYRRATDLIPFGIDRSIPPYIVEISSQSEITEVINDLEDQLFTGVVKVSCSPGKSRGAVLLWNGKVLGCIYGQKTRLNRLPTEDSLKLLLNDCKIPGTQILRSSLSEDVVLPMSALFLGYPVEIDDTQSAPRYLRYLKEWFLKKKQTACVAISIPTNGAVLDFVYKGKPIGSFEVEYQRYSPAKDTITRADRLVQLHPRCRVECSILAPDPIDKLGFRLTNRRLH